MITSVDQLAPGRQPEAVDATLGGLHATLAAGREGSTKLLGSLRRPSGYGSLLDTAGVSHRDDGQYIYIFIITATNICKWSVYTGTYPP